MNPTWQEMEALLERLEHLGDPDVREDARALIRLLMQMHGDALARLMEITHQSGHAPLLDAWKNDPQIGRLLLIHGLHPDDVASRVRQALAEVSGIAAFIGVEVSVVRSSEEEVLLNLVVGADVPPQALADLRGRIEAAIVNEAPEVQAVRFEGGPRRFGLPLLSPAAGHEA